MSKINALSNNLSQETEAWKNLSSLAPNFRLDSVDAVPDGLFLRGADKFAAAANGHVVFLFSGKIKKKEAKRLS